MRNEQCRTKAPCRKNCPILNQFSSIKGRLDIVSSTQTKSEIDKVKNVDARRLRCPPGAVGNAEIKIFERVF